MGASSPAVDCDVFLHRACGPIFDVRSPCEYASGHIPGSHSLPLFTDAERAMIGTVYKQRGRDAAVQLGLQAVGPKLGEMAATLRSVLQKSKASSCRVTCFRGGMRSRSVQWLCEFLGVPAVRLDGGYKAFRHAVLDTFSRPYRFIVIGGPTGSGKTDWIATLRQKGCQAIDLEALANHRGSAFGLVPGAAQPTTEQFENLLAAQLWGMDPRLPIFIEDESRRIGSCTIPHGIYDTMDRSQLLWLEVLREDRVNRILSAYGEFPTEWAVACTQKLAKRLGGERTQKIVHALESGHKDQAVDCLLQYYDQLYLHSRSLHPRQHIPITTEALAKAIEERSFVGLGLSDPSC